MGRHLVLEQFHPARVREVEEDELEFLEAQAPDRFDLLDDLRGRPDQEIALLAGLLRGRQLVVDAGHHRVAVDAVE